ncbi:hypothetical protein BD289DRAFT_486736 [Coniella lustricola]|uniref:Uncharacterized protein n=1 Tax=Coniella lustricola TaxID=2025994 RepID=A0A2T2ZU71_9PEZI|nr:hypothetical protein BD289DRAFT_486736 [Coniella lustricola]
MLFNTEAFILFGLSALTFVSPIHHNSERGIIRERKAVKGAKCSTKIFTKDQVGQAYAEAKAHVAAKTSVRGYPKRFGNNLSLDPKTKKCVGTPVYAGLMNDLIEYPIYADASGTVMLWSAAAGKIGGDMKYRVVLKANGNFVGVMEHTAGSSFKMCTLIEEEDETTGATSLIPDNTAETICTATTSTT